MKLTNYLRDAFVTAVMADVPCENYQEKAEALVRQDAYEKLPAKIKAIYDDKELRHFISTKYYGFNRFHFHSITVHAEDTYEPSQDVMIKLNELNELHKAQLLRNDELKRNLENAIYSVTTVKNARELLVDFADYLPDETKPTKQLPAISGLNEAFKAAGFPKDKKGA